jgi:hypothetical protein
MRVGRSLDVPAATELLARIRASGGRLRAGRSEVPRAAFSGPVGRVGLRSVRRADSAEFVCSGRPRLEARGGKKVATLAAAETREFARVEVRHHGPTSSRLKRRGQLCNRSGTGRPLNEVPGEASGGGSLWAQGVYRRRESIAAGSLSPQGVPDRWNHGAGESETACREWHADRRASRLAGAVSRGLQLYPGTVSAGRASG